ncbi:hypothetical protein LTR28_013545, partial [Elasticomyces elasticus]
MTAASTFWVPFRPCPFPLPPLSQATELTNSIQRSPNGTAYASGPSAKPPRSPTPNSTQRLPNS